ncbi:family 10 glycosylhydrolase [Sphingobacterium sp. SRCM116780]|uniref:family 10 glycosylhydrolase n=1 Tax=Sphingobacterium sp. SRCM116780 TaxID=2907623 RepID=UPI001F1EFA3B|nr:family 10 glycosylhydrolase [Sphingobacterium sp. SRCM116780]UIR54653.1 family 10 glycosylhydrolase [Sphingobacterium sp. SRCM116780]
MNYCQILRVYVLVLLGLVLFTNAEAKSAKIDEPPMFWTWLGYSPTMNFDSVCNEIHALGIDGIMLNAPTPDDYRVAIPIAQKYGIKIVAWLWTMNLEHDREKILKEHPEWFSVNRNGKSLADTTAYVGYYKFLSPVLPEVRDYIKKRVESYCAIEGLSGISIDYHRYVDVVLPTTLWPKYNIVQDREYPAWDFGYHPVAIQKFKAQYGYDPREQKDPSKDLKWRQFRCDQITEVANMIADVVHASGKTMAASPFPTPKMASRMVRQDWGKWKLDIVFPMVYSNYYTEDVSFITDCTIENSQDKNQMTNLYCGLMASNSDAMFTDMDAALNHGAQGISIFTVNGIRDPEIKRKFKNYTDQAKAKKAANHGVMPIVGQNTVEKDPFKKEGIMQLIHTKIQKLVANSDEETNLPTIALSKFKKVDAYDVTQRYLVEDKLSKKKFHVTFYFYGGILSGWNVDATS